jgi:hypothetical protein
MAQATTNIVLVHGGFVDGSGWESVYNILKKDGYNVAILQVGIRLTTNWSRKS